MTGDAGDAAMRAQLAGECSARGKGEGESWPVEPGCSGSVRVGPRSRGEREEWVTLRWEKPWRLGEAGFWAGGVALRAGPARAGPMREKERAGLGCCWVGPGLVFYFPFSFLFLLQTKFEFKYEFEFKPHSNKGMHQHECNTNF